MDLQLLWFLLALLLVLTGVVGLVLPALPGAPLLFGGLLLAAWAEDFEYVGFPSLLLIAVLCGLTLAVDFLAGVLGAKRVGASPMALFGAAIGIFAGFLIGPLGFFLGPFVGAVLGELAARRTLGEAGRVGLGVTLGLVLGAAVKLALAFCMLGVFLLARFAL